MATFSISKWTYIVQGGTGDLSVYESHKPGVVRYVGPYFYLNASVTYDAPTTEDWTVGIVQVCESIELTHRYNNDNYTKWEFATPISDFWESNSGTSFPYYTLDSPNPISNVAQVGVGRLKLTNAKGIAELSMNDNLASNVQYWDPVPNGRDQYKATYTHRLTNIERKQKFKTFVIAHRGVLSSTGVYRVLGSVGWRHHLVMDFDCTKPIGQRCTAQFGADHGVTSHHRQNLQGGTLPNCCFVQVCANKTQKLRGYKPSGWYRNINW